MSSAHANDSLIFPHNIPTLLQVVIVYDPAKLVPKYCHTTKAPKVPWSSPRWCHLPICKRFTNISAQYSHFVLHSAKLFVTQDSCWSLRVQSIAEALLQQQQRKACATCVQSHSDSFKCYGTPTLKPAYSAGMLELNMSSSHHNSIPQGRQYAVLSQRPNISRTGGRV